uniref:leucine-rich repeat receptor-like serine/threonine/tyrosine-protein kinase SOBIR1 n=1 Tax=Erigeron canadensis TaxID=72917 RepID=UPI001CB8CA99|nr:leucine-rich repeat receptor-like serine/threonine/tyrosine-protein kinase SOBIR1 [Erigeron canadensis]
MATVIHLPLLIFLTLNLLINAKLNLDPNDHNALSAVFVNLGVSGKLQPPTNFCTAAGIFCERRTSNNSYTFKVTGMVLKSQRRKGSLSPEIGKLLELNVIDLSNNEFSGEVPTELCYLFRLRILDLSNNRFSGELGFLKYFPNLEKLSLENNMFTGKVPISLRSFRNLRFFNVSGNSLLDGPLPELRRLEYVAPEVKKYSYGRYKFIESTNSTNSKNGNSQFPATSPAPAPAEGRSVKHKKSNKKKILGWVLGFLGGSFGGILSALIFSVLFKMCLIMIKGSGDPSGPSIFSQSITAEELAFLEDDEAIRALQVIGRGGCGEVYKTDLPEGKIKTIAIKQVIQPSKDAAELTLEDTKTLNKKMRQIRSEIQTVGQIRHRNLLSLLAHVSRPTCHYLVYEYMKNGSLQDILQQVQDGRRELDWLARYKIAIGVATGLEYLHMNHTPRIVHRDLKPANVLLDDDMEARIADFGLAKSIPDAETHMTSSNVAGTLGYIAPEYHQTMKFTDKCDIYSFGVVLGVLVVGRLPSDDFFQHTSEVSLVKWMRKVMTSDDPKEAIDPSLLGNGYQEQMLLVLKIACFCTLDNPKERPNSKDCRIMLAQIEH